VEYYEPIIREGHTYLMANGHVKHANKKFTNIMNEYSVTFDKHSIVKDLTAAAAEEDPSSVLEDDEAAKKQQVTPYKDNGQQFLNIEEIYEKYFDTPHKPIDLKAVLLEIGCTQTIQLRTGEMKTRTSMIIGDDSLRSILCCIWGREYFKLKPIDPSNPTILFFKKVKVSTFCNFSLNVNDDCVVIENPDDPAAHELREWKVKLKKDLKFNCLSDMTE
jgi:replication factor A1